MNYKTKDSGKREQFDSGAVRDVRAGKGRYDLVSFLALGRIAGVYERGAAKYADRNWEQGIPISRNIDSALRHIAQFMVGENDEDHLAQAAWNLIAALHFDEGIKRGMYSEGLDDRPRYPYATHGPNRGEVAKLKALVEEARVKSGKQRGPAPGATEEAYSATFQDPTEKPAPNFDTLTRTTEEAFARASMPEVQHSSTEQWHSQVVLHDPNHSESEGAWHYHEDGDAYSTQPSYILSRPHRHHSWTA